MIPDDFIRYPRKTGEPTPATDTVTPMKTIATPRKRIDGMFLKGPVPMDWLNRAASLPGKALHVAVAICLWHGILRCDEFRLSTGKLRSMGVERNSAYRALTSLEEAGLIRVQRHRGRNPIVTVVGL